MTSQPVNAHKPSHNALKRANSISVPVTVKRIATNLETVCLQPAGPATTFGEAVKPFRDPQRPGDSQCLPKAEKGLVDLAL